MKFAIFTKTDKDVSKQYQMVEQAAKNASFTFDNENPDVVFVLGGDGTLLKAVQRYIDIVDNIKFVGFRCGNLGFFYDFNEEDIRRISRFQSATPGDFGNLSSRLRFMNQEKVTETYLTDELCKMQEEKEFGKRSIGFSD